jgi:hypothetical protein
MFDLGMRTSDVEQESRSTHAPSFGVIAFWLCSGFAPVASPCAVGSRYGGGADSAETFEPPQRSADEVLTRESLGHHSTRLRRAHSSSRMS